MLDRDADDLALSEAEATARTALERMHAATIEVQHWQSIHTGPAKASAEREAQAGFDASIAQRKAAQSDLNAANDRIRALREPQRQLLL
jgi:hypothetical protein